MSMSKCLSSGVFKVWYAYHFVVRQRICGGTPHLIKVHGTFSTGWHKNAVITKIWMTFEMFNQFFQYFRFIECSWNVCFWAFRRHGLRRKDVIVEAYFKLNSCSCNSKNDSDVENFLSTQWSADGSTSSEPMGLYMTSMIKHQQTIPLWTTEIIKDTTQRRCSQRLLTASQASLWVGEVKNLESTRVPWREFWSPISTCNHTGYSLNKSLHLTACGSEWKFVSAILRQDCRCTRL